ncbi:MAG: DNA photolyase family protein [Roseibium sp.]|uniref:cryptochrome/photolyase family protein n=1 Tax=Roseibium sp. TaxID=1936156 RepID=UPI0026387187|nr:deoxyribodipyrimidine photo-lyase [Roseibium sp.]MCV0427505.1 DNA photolyase family protein [Roseibium sp.]
MTTLVWFRHDLRINDNPALFEAVARGRILPVFIRETPEQSGEDHPLGGASNWWLHHSLAALKKSLPGLVLLKGCARHLIPALAKDTGVEAVYWNRGYEPHVVERDADIKNMLKSEGFEARSFKANLLFEPWEMKTGTGGPFKVYSPFWRAMQKLGVQQPLPAPGQIEFISGHDGVDLDQFDLLPEAPNWAARWNDIWDPGETGAEERLTAFLSTGLEDYGDLRNRPDLPKVSRLSPHLHFGEISPRRIWHETLLHVGKAESLRADAMKFLSEIAWREFSSHLLFHFPKLPSENWRPAFDAYPWRNHPADLENWQKGQTGYPIVDAGMRELWQTGYVHNRVRMIVASFLVKHLRLHWYHGEAWFRDTLVDADLANNSASWQWVTGSGADAAPYFRVFNPISQGQKFDPNGAYIRKWVPELKDLETAFLFAPFDAPSDVLTRAGVELGENYPHPIVDHAAARKAALEGYSAVKEAGQNAA